LTTSCPRRGCTAAFVATVNGIVVSPCPEAVALNAIQSTSLLTLHAHSRFTTIFNDAVAPDASTALGSAVAVTAQRPLDDGAVTLVEDDDPHAVSHSMQAPARIA
jgi:hypothetical protein